MIVMDDLISREDAIEAFDGVKVDEENCTEYDNGYNDGIDFTVSTLFVLPSARQWIPCEKEMPKVTSKSANVLAYCEMGTMEILYWDGGNWCHPTGEYYDWKNWVNGYQNKVIAWMPLPKPYEVNHE